MAGYVGGSDRLGASAATTALVAAGANVVVPGSGAVVGAAEALFGGLFGGTSQTDQQRIARVSYFYNLAVAGNVGAAQVMLGAIPDVAGDEQGYWQKALQQLQTANPQAYAAAATAGGVRFTGQGDSATSYPHMQAYALNWAASNAPVGIVSSYGGTTTTTTGVAVTATPTGIAPRVQTLPLMTTTAAYNWWPIAAGAAGVGLIALFAFSNRGRR